MEDLFQLSAFHALDSKFRLHYGPQFERVLTPCDPIGDEALALGFIDNNQINPARLLLLAKDRVPVRVTIPGEERECSVPHPGKSAILCLDTMQCGPDVLWRFVTHQLSSEKDRRDHIHVATVGEVKQAGWTPMWAPLQLEQKTLHVRLVAERTLRDRVDPTEEDAARLAQAFMKLF